MSAQNESRTISLPVQIDYRSHFPAELAAGEFLRDVLARRLLLQTLFFAIKSNGDEASALIDRRVALYPDPPSDYDDLSNDERDLHEAIATHMALSEDSSVALIMLLDAPLRRLGDASGEDQRNLGDYAYNGVKLTRAIWALANRHRHLYEWRSLSEDALYKNQSAAILKTLDLNPLDSNATYNFMKRCAFDSYFDFEQRARSVVSKFLTGPYHDVTATANSVNLTIHFERLRKDRALARALKSEKRKRSTQTGKCSAARKRNK